MLDEILWQQNTHLAEACLHHPFVRGLADGTLYPEAFRRYVAQDAFFLNAFARAYALAAARSQDGETLISLCELLNGVLRELQLHAGYAKELKIELARVQPYRQVEAYTDFLLATAWHGEPGEHDPLSETNRKEIDHRLLIATTDRLAHKRQAGNRGPREVGR